MKTKPTAKILLTLILKDDSEFKQIDRMLKTFMPYVHGLVAVLTGVSGDFNKLQALIKGYGGHTVTTSPDTHPKIYAKDGDKWIFANFAEARNVSFELAAQQKGYDWWMWADADDILVNGQELQAVADKALESNIDSVFFTYWYSINIHTDGTFSVRDVQIDHLRERLLRPGIFKWVSRLHEVCVPKEDNYRPTNTVYDFSSEENRELAWAHLSDENRISNALERNIKILEIQAREEQHKDPRTLFYLAKTYFDLNTPENNGLAEMLIQDYLTKSGWREERGNAWEYLARISIRRGDHQSAVTRLHKAIEEHPSHHMAYLLLAREYAELKMFEESHHWLEVAVRMDAPKARTTIGNPMEIKLLASELKYNEAMRQMKLDEAINWLKTRNKIIGSEDEGMLKALEDAKLYNDAGIWVFNYAKYLKEQGHEDKIANLLRALTPDHAKEPFAHMIANEFVPPQKWSKNSIVYYGSWGAAHFEEWDEKSLAKGIGGSETAIIRLSQEWAKKGYEVTVFAECSDHDDEFGVHWRHWSQINWKDEFNVLILWRSPHLLDKDIKAKKLFMDLHDISSQLDYTEERMKKLDGVFFKSNWHRQQVPKLPDEKARIISNGI